LQSLLVLDPSKKLQFVAAKQGWDFKKAVTTFKRMQSLKAGEIGRDE
jgi:hypothetical protein